MKITSAPGGILCYVCVWAHLHYVALPRQVPNTPMRFHLSLHDLQSHVHVGVRKGTSKIKPPRRCLINGRRNEKPNEKPNQALPAVVSSICLWNIVSQRDRQMGKPEPENCNTEKWNLWAHEKASRNLASNDAWSWWFKIKFSWGADPGMCGISACKRQDVEGGGGGRVRLKSLVFLITVLPCQRPLRCSGSKREWNCNYVRRAQRTEH